METYFLIYYLITELFSMGLMRMPASPYPSWLLSFIFIHGNCRGVKRLWVYNHEEKTKTKKHGYCVLVDSKKIFF